MIRLDPGFRSTELENTLIFYLFYRGEDIEERILSNLIIGIHGFARKPPLEELARGWLDAVLEGLSRNCGLELDPEHELDLFDFKLVYWADEVHSPLEKDPEPYLPAPGKGPLPRYEDDWVDELVADVIDVGESIMDFAMRHPELHRKTGWLLERICRDCERYNQDSRLRNAIRAQLESVLLSSMDQKILILGHSMGSVIAYEVLRSLEDRYHQPIVDHLIGLGSPMGFPFLTQDLKLRHLENRMPNTVAEWTNLTDRRDLAAFDVHLRDDYGPNDHGSRVRDDLVINSYLCPQQRSNTHKAYGYLRAPEVSELIQRFLRSSKSNTTGNSSF